MDTNVLSELRRKRPDPNVADWFAKRSATSLFSSVLTQGEIRKGNDSLLAATALRHGLRMVTRNVSDFAGLSVEVINPWNRG